MALDNTLVPAFEPASDTPVADSFQPASTQPTSSVSDSTVKWIKGLEGFSPKAFGDYKQTSIGYGTRARKGETTISEEDADQRLRSELETHALRVDEAAAENGYDLTPGMRDALISFDFNTGSGVSLLQAGEGNPNYLASRLPHYVYAGGKINQGLINRRQDEINRFVMPSTQKPFEPTEDFEPASAEPVKDDTGVDTIHNMVGSAFLEINKLGAAVHDNLGAMGASTARTLGLNGVADWMQKHSDDASQRRKWYKELETGNYSQSNPFAPGGEQFDDFAGYVNPAKQDDAATGVAHVAADIPGMVANPLAYFVMKGSAESGSDAAAQGENRLGAATKGGLVTGATLALFHGTGKVASRLIPETLSNPASRFIVGTAAAAGMNMVADTAVQAATGGHVLPQTPREWAERGLFDLGFAALHGADEAKLPQRLIAAGQQIDHLDGFNQYLAENPGDRSPEQLAQLQGMIAKQRTALTQLLQKHAGLLNQIKGTKAADFEPASAEPIPEEATPAPVPAPAAGATGEAALPLDAELPDPNAAPASIQEPTAATTPPPAAPAAGGESAAPAGSPEGGGSAPRKANWSPQERETLVRQRSFPAGLVDWLDPQSGAALMNSKPGTNDGIATLQVAMLKAQRAKDASLTSEPAASTPEIPALTPAPGESGLTSPARTDLSGSRGASSDANTAPAEIQRGDADETGAAEPVEIDADAPFSKQPGSPEAQEEARIQKLMRDQLRAVGERSAPAIVVVDSVDQIPRQLAGETARQAVSSGSIVEAYFITSRRKDGSIARRMVVVRDGAEQVAKDRGMTLDARAKQLALHEIVHNYGSLGALFGKETRRAYNATVDGLLGKLAKSDPDLLEYLTKSKADGGYGFDLSNAADRAAAAEEYLARFNEGTTKAPDFVTRAIAGIKQVLRTAFPKLQWTDGDVRALLDSARRRSETAAQNEAPVRMSAQSSEEKPQRLADVLKKFADSNEAWRYPREVKGKTPERIAEELSVPGRPIFGEEIAPDEIRFKTHRGYIELLQHPNGDWEISAPSAESQGNEEGGGSQLYQAAFAWAHNNGERIIPSDNLSPINQLRRTSNMLSSALRFGTTDHLEPDFDQGLDQWQPGNHDANIETMARRESALVLRKFPELASLTIDPKTLTVRDAHGQPVTNDQIRGIIEHLDPDYAKGVGVGTAKRALLTRSADLLSGDRAGSGELGKRLSSDADRGGLKRILYSAQPRAEDVAADEQKRRGFIESVKSSPNIAEPVRDTVESLYKPITNKDTVEAARARINEIGLEKAENEVLTTDQPSAQTYAQAIELMGRLQSAGEYERAAKIAEAVAEKSTSQGQAIQALSLLGKLTPEGVQVYAQRVVKKAIESGGPDLTAAHEQIEKLKDQLKQARDAGATQTIVDLQTILKGAGWDSGKLNDVNQKLRQALLIATQQPGNAETMIRGLLINAGMERGQANKLAKRAVADIQRRMQRARDTQLRGMLRLKQGQPATAELETAIQQRIRQAVIDNPGSLWQRYKQQAAAQLGNTAAQMADPQARVQTPALQDFTARLLNELKKQLPPEAQPKTPADHIGLLAQAVNESEKYRDVWNAARKYVADKYRGNPQMLDRLDKIVGHKLDRPFSESTMQRAIDQGLKSFDTNMRDLLLRSHLDKAVARQQMVSLVADRIGLRGGEAAKLGNDIMDAWGRSEQKAREAYAKGLFKDPIAKVPKSQIERWIEMNNAGLLDDQRYQGEIARKYGFPAFTSTDAARIADLQKAYEQAKPGDEKLVAGAKMMDAIHSLVPSGFWAKANSVRNMAMLLNPKTVIRIVGGNTALMLSDVAADSLTSWVVDPLTSLVTGNRVRTSANVAARANGVLQPWRDFWIGVEHGKEAGETRPLHLFAEGVEYLRHTAELANKGLWDPRNFSATMKHTFSSRVGRLFEDALTLVHGVGPRAFHAAAFADSVQRQMKVAKRNGQELLAPTPEMLETAALDGNRAILQDKNVANTVLLAVKRALNYVSPETVMQGLRGEKLQPGQLGLGSALMPFAKIPGGAIARGVEFSPLGFIRSAYELMPSAIKGGHEFDQRTFVDSFSRAIVGSAGYALGAYLFKLGVISALPDEDKDLEAMRRKAGLGGLRVNVSELWRRMLSGNWHTMPKSMFEAAQDGDNVVSYEFAHPAAFMLAAGAQAQVEADKQRIDAEGGKIPKSAAPWISGLLGASKAAEHLSVVNGLKKFTEVSGSRESLSEAAADQVLTVPASFVPQVVKALNDLYDNKARETQFDSGKHPLDTAVDAVRAKLPGLAQQLPPRYDAFGQAMEKYQYGGNTLFNVFINPAFASTVRKTPELRELERIYDATLNKEATPAAPNRTITLNTGRPDIAHLHGAPKQVELTNEQLAAYKYFVGRVATDRLQLLMAAPGWAKMPEALSAKYVGNAWRDAATAGKIVLFNDKPSSADAGAVAAVLRGRAISANKAP